MEPLTGQGNKARKIRDSILAGLGQAFVSFLVAAVVTFFLIYAFFSLFGTFSEVGPMLAIALSPIVGVVTAIIIGIRSGRQTYKRLSEQK